VTKTDVELWLQDAALGDREALDRLVAVVRPAVFRYCRARLWDLDTAEDVTQDVLLIVFQAIPKQDPPVRDLEAFAITIASRQIATAHRRRAARPEQGHDEVPDVVDSAPGPDTVIALNDDVRVLNVLLQQLTSVQREVVLLRVVNGLSAEDTGTVLGMTPGNVRVMQHRALTRLRALVQQEVAV
jgi:RNA polymerase sigma-70 factor, ECF subfamily